MSDGKAYWYRKGKIIEVKGLHIEDVCEHYDIFGLTKEYVQETYDAYNETWGEEGYAREEIMVGLMSNGWIRIRETYNREGNKWTIQFDDFKKRKKDIQEIVAILMYDYEVLRDYDTLVLLQCVGNYYKIYDKWKNGNKPSDVFLEMKKKRKMARTVYSYDEFLED